MYIYFNILRTVCPKLYTDFLVQGKDEEGDSDRDRLQLQGHSPRWRQGWTRIDRCRVRLEQMEAGLDSNR